MPIVHPKHMTLNNQDQPVDAQTPQHRGFSVRGLPAFNDNYIWIVVATNGSGQGHGIAIVDPGDAAPVIDYCRRHGLVPDQIWLTHHHADHTGGVAELRDWVGRQFAGHELVVYGPAIEQIPGVTHLLDGDMHFSLGDMPLEVLSVPGHTRGHLAYLVGAPSEVPALFCGDTLFGLGCGRLFEGTALQMFKSLARIAALPPETRIYCAHEYTLLNLPFALAVDPHNAELQARAERIRQRCALGEATVPLMLSDELLTNPFLRSDQSALHEAAMLPAGASPLEVFTRLRQMRDTFKASH